MKTNILWNQFLAHLMKQTYTLCFQDRYYVMVNKDASMDEVARFMAVAWHHRTPKMVLSIISSYQYFVPWSTPKFEEDFRDGIIQVSQNSGLGNMRSHQSVTLYVNSGLRLEKGSLILPNTICIVYFVININLDIIKCKSF